jgi:hypothetical protein
MNAKILIGLTSLLATSSLFAADSIPPTPAPVTRTISYKHTISQVSATGNFEIILTTAYSDRIILEGEQSPVEQVETVFKNGKLSVYDNRLDKTRALRIYVAAKELTHLSVYGQGTVSSEGKVVTSLQQVLLDGEIEVKVNATGKVNVIAGYDYDLIQKKP